MQPQQRHTMLPRRYREDFAVGHAREARVDATEIRK
jgi:hypothetical protein